MMKCLPNVELLKATLESTLSNLRDVDLVLPPRPANMLNIRYSDEVPEPHKIQNGCPIASSTTELRAILPVNARYLTSGNDVRKVMKITLDVKDVGVKFQPGDTIGILPTNSDSEVEQIVEYVGVKKVLNKKCTLELMEGNLKKKSIPNYIPSSSTLYTILKTCVDIRAIPKKVLLRVLADYTNDESEKHLLEALCSRQGAAIYSSCILEPGVSVLDILAAFPSCQPPVERLLEQMPRLMPRPYSIASSPLKSADSLDIVLTVVDSPREGVCSGWLNRALQPFLNKPWSLEEQFEEKLSIKGANCVPKIPLFFRKSMGFSLPEETDIPLILIGPGTGIAPFIGFLYHREAQKELSPDADFGDIWLFTGCRYADRDFLFKSEIEHFLKKGVLTRVLSAFSREGNGDGTPKYVQDNIWKHKEDFVNLLVERKSILYLCGDAKNMAKDVWNTVVQVVSSELGMSEDEAQHLLVELQKAGRYRQDVWT